MNFPILTFLTFIPVVGMVIILFLKKENVQAIKYTTLFATGVQLILSIFLMSNYNYLLGGINDASAFQFVEKFRWIEIPDIPWIGTIKVDYFMGVDGLSTPMVLLTAIVTFIATLSSWTIDRQLKGYFALFLLLDTGMMGVFVSLDFFMFFIFWEIMLLPMYFLIGIWGGPRREYAAIKFFLYTLFGSIFILLVMIGLFFSTKETLVDGSKVFTFNILELMNTANYTVDGILSPLNPDNW
ncbi:MAG: proton-conducting transporter membrane subunit, partial [Ignavibacteriaceae bacterium]|nr:proton-conducting transporter membrane subunit [Ignavibacteriaceae bacterium]